MSEVLTLTYLYLPLSLIGLWRWSVWLTHKLGATLYRPSTAAWPQNKPKPKLSVVTPVYNENPVIWNQALKSWIKAGADEIIAVIDKTNTRLIVDYETYFVPHKKVHCKLIVTPKVGKRAALCDGIEQASGDIIALVDSDTIWSDNVARAALPHFLNAKVGGVGVPQRVYRPRKLTHYLFDILLWNRYQEEVAFMLGMGNVFNTLSGRTAFYRREALLHAKHDNLHHLRHEFYFGTRGISGDDKRLTHLILEQGWQLSLALNAVVYTPCTDSLKTFLKQRLRWTRNSWRADSRAFARRWVLRHPALAFHNFDRFIQPFFMLLGPAALVLLVLQQQWLLVIILLIWWFASRLIKLFSYFRLHPIRIIYLPAYILFTYLTALMKIYAWATLLEHSWATRWHKHRLQVKRAVQRFGTVGAGVTAVVGLLVVIGVFINRLQTEAGTSLQSNAAVADEINNFSLDLPASRATLPPQAKNTLSPEQIKTYTVRSGDSLNELAGRWGLSVQEIKFINSLVDPDEITAGQQLLYFDLKRRS